MRVHRIVLLIIVSALSLEAQNFSGGFSFYLPPADTSTQRFLPQFPSRPLTDQDFVSIDREGHFSVRNTPIRFFGTNLVADAAFPTKSKAWFIAGRLRKMGFNLVRFHHLDNPWSRESIFNWGSSTRSLNPITLDRLDKILAELKANGIYANMNLHVSRTLRNSDGIADADSLQDYGKGINYFDPQILELHKEYARQLLTHVNPYTGFALVNDPVMAMVEMTNENSLYRYWREGKLKPLAQGGILTIRHTKLLDSLWLGYLKSLYLSTSSLSSAWNVGARNSTETNLVQNGSFENAGPSVGWVMETHAPAMATMTRDSVQPQSGRYSAKVLVTNSDGTDWHLQWKQVGLSVVKDSLYTVTFAGRSNGVRSISVSVMRDVSPWTWYGGASVTLAPEWKVFSLSLRAPETVQGVIRLSFAVGANAGTYWFDDIILAPGSIRGLIAGESLEGSSVRRLEYAECPSFTDQRVRDLSSFYIKLQNEYFAEMASYLKSELNVKVPIVGTNWNVGPADLAVQSKLDYIDNHAYWDHPSFPRQPWSSTDWYIANSPMVQSQIGGTIVDLMAGVPMKNKPFTISEYNHAFPNRYQTEALLFLTSYSSFHDVDGLMFFDYNGSVDDWESDKVNGYFSISRNTAMMALVPSCAFAYRNGMISKAKQTLTVNYAPLDYLLLPKRDNGGWQGPALFAKKVSLKHAVRAGSYESSAPMDFSSFPPEPSNPFVTDTKEIEWNTSGTLAVASGRFVGVTGFLNTRLSQPIGPLTLRAANVFGSLTWISLTPDSIHHAARSLVTISSKLQNTGMIWDGTTTVHDNWGGPPTLVQPVMLMVEMRIEADSIRVTPLDQFGRESFVSAMYHPSAPNSFIVLLDQNRERTPWFGVEKFGRGVSTGSDDGRASTPLEFRLEQNYPNPFNPLTRIRFSIPRSSAVSLKVFDSLGRCVAVLAEELMQPGSYERTLDASALAGGVYFYRLAATQYSHTNKLLILK